MTTQNLSYPMLHAVHRLSDEWGPADRFNAGTLRALEKRGHVAISGDRVCAIGPATEARTALALSAHAIECLRSCIARDAPFADEIIAPTLAAMGLLDVDHDTGKHWPTRRANLLVEWAEIVRENRGAR